MGHEIILTIEMTFLGFLPCHRLLVEIALGEQRQMERRCWHEGNDGALSREMKVFISTV